jgi:hypothetical protein
MPTLTHPMTRSNMPKTGAAQLTESATRSPAEQLFLVQGRPLVTRCTDRGERTYLALISDPRQNHSL